MFARVLAVGEQEKLGLPGDKKESISHHSETMAEEKKHTHRHTHTHTVWLGYVLCTGESNPKALGFSCDVSISVGWVHRWARTWNQRTALHYAARNGRLEAADVARPRTPRFLFGLQGTCSTGWSGFAQLTWILHLGPN